MGSPPAVRGSDGRTPARHQYVAAIALLLGGALVAGSLIWLVQWAASPELVPLLDQDFQPDELQVARGGLEALGEKVEVRGSRLYVRPSANRQTLIAQLQQQEKLPANTSTAFANLVKETNPWIGEREAIAGGPTPCSRRSSRCCVSSAACAAPASFLNLNAQKGFSRTPRRARPA